MPHPIRAAFSVPYGAQFGANRAGGKRKHAATDYHAPIGTPIYGTGDGGRVASIGYAPDANLGLGHWVRIDYPGGRSTTDAHMRERTTLAVGAPVTATTLIGYIGITGNAVNADPPGSHDHHECRINGALVNPHTLYAGGTTTAGDVGTPLEDDMTEAQFKRLEALGVEGNRVVTAAWAEAKEAVRISQANWVLLKMLEAGTKDDATEASVKEAVRQATEAVRVSQAVWERQGMPVTLADEVAKALSDRFGVGFEDVKESLSIILTEQIGTVNEKLDNLAGADPFRLPPTP